MDLLPRVISAVVLILVVLGGLVLGGIALDVLVALAAAVGAFELRGLLRRLVGLEPQLWLLITVAVWSSQRAILPGAAGSLEYILSGAIGIGLLVDLVTATPFSSWAASLAGGLYLGVGLGSLLGIAHYRAGDARFDLVLIATVIGSVVACDTLAYFTGFALGRHPFFSRVSPSKTVEGAVGGLCGAIAVSTAIGVAVIGLDWYWAVAMGAVIGISAQGGDLAESALKRQADVKDSGNLIPGHGGVLDRLDSLLLVGPAVLCFLHLIGTPA